MIIVRWCESRGRVADFLFRACQDYVDREYPSRLLTRSQILEAVREWDILEFVDSEKEVIIGSAAREPSNYLHIYIDAHRRVSWAPHTTLQRALDILLSDSGKLYAMIPSTDKATMNMAIRLGFIATGVRNNSVFYALTAQTRQELYMKVPRPPSLPSVLNLHGGEELLISVGGSWSAFSG